MRGGAVMKEERRRDGVTKAGADMLPLYRDRGVGGAE